MCAISLPPLSPCPLTSGRGQGRGRYRGYVAIAVWHVYRVSKGQLSGTGGNGTNDKRLGNFALERKGVCPQARHFSLYWSLFVSFFLRLVLSTLTLPAPANTCAIRLVLGIWYRNIDWPLRLLQTGHYVVAGLETLLGLEGVLSTTVVVVVGVSRSLMGASWSLVGVSRSRPEIASFARVVALQPSFASTSTFFNVLSDSFPKLIFPNAWLRSSSTSTLSLSVLARSLTVGSVIKVCLALVEPGGPDFGDRKGICGLAAA